MEQWPGSLCTVSPFAEQSRATEYLKVSNQMPIQKPPLEEPLLCAVCGCKWVRGGPPDDECNEITCPCHHLWIVGLDELAKRYLWGDR